MKVSFVGSGLALSLLQHRRAVAIVSTCLILLSLVLTVVAQDTYQQAYEKGYLDGQKAGETDRLRSRPYDFANKTLYQDATSGFEPEEHEREVYVPAYRQGFEYGYEQGYGLNQSEADLVSKPAVVVNPVDTRFRLPSGTAIEVRLLNVLSTQRNERGDTFEAEVSEAVKVEEQVAIPVGTKVSGIISHLRRAGRIKGRSEMNLQFNELELPNGLKVPISATVVSLEERADEEVKDEEGTIEGKSTTSRDLKRVGGGTGVGALIGLLTGGGKGAKIGAAVGAVAGAAGTLATRGSDIVLYPDTEIVIELDRDAAISPGILRRGRR